MKHEISIAAETFSFQALNGKIVFEGYDFTSESIVAKLGADSRFVIFWEGLQAVLDQSGPDSFDDQFRKALVNWSYWKSEQNKISVRRSIVDLGKKKESALALWLVACWWDNDHDVVRDMAIHSLSSAPLLAVLAQDQVEMIRWSVAENIFTSKKTLALLSTDRSYLVLDRVAFNKRTPQGVLLRLSDDKSLRKAVITNSSAPISLHTKYMRDPDEEVRKSIAYKSQDIKILHILSQDDSQMVRLAVAYKLNESPSLRREMETLSLAQDMETSAL